MFSTVTPNLLILDDDQCFAASAASLARSDGYHVHIAQTISAAREVLQRHRIDLMLLELTLPDGSGLDLVDGIDVAEHGQIVIVTACPTLESATRAVSAPVIQYLIKPLDYAQLQTLLASVRTRDSFPSHAESGAIAGLIGDSAVLQEVKAAIRCIGPSDASVLITGESGTGKEIVARALHDVSSRCGPFVAVNCGAVAPDLLASQLFGHERGSFTGANSRHIGFVEQAAHGTLFLDEITEMAPSLQVYLLRVLESGAVTRVGGREEIAIPLRVVAATNSDPMDAVAKGKLRQDLYYRLADIPMVLPPLRERGDDVLQLARVFVNRLNARYDQDKKLARQCERCLLSHPWPGNVRELRSAVQRAYLQETGRSVHVRPMASAPWACRETQTSITFSIGTTYAEIERRMLLKTLKHFGNDKTAAARALGINVRTVHNQLARMDASAIAGQSSGEAAA